MNSYIEEFEEKDREKNSDLIVSICGPSGAGKGTLGRFVADELEVSFYSAGDFFRQIADEKGMSVEELSEEADRETDVEVDRRTLEKGLNQNCVIESRISAWVLGDYADLSIYVTAELEERARRVLDDLENRDTEEGGENLDEVKKRVRKRDRDNRERYRKYYGIDTGNTEIFDLFIDNTDLGIEEQERLVKKALRRTGL
ncbi:MAG: (d)CMP kinase [Candidatus Nanohalobium sp.]